MYRHLPIYADTPSLSKSDLLLSGCIVWALPGSEWSDRSDTTARDHGTAIHSMVYEAGQEPHSALYPKEVQGMVDTLFEYKKLYPEHYQELAVAWNPVVGKAVVQPEVKDRQYNKDLHIEHGWIWGTADFVGVGEDHVFVADVKTGMAGGACAQLMSLGYAFSQAWSKDPSKSILEVWKPWDEPLRYQVGGQMEAHCVKMAGAVNAYIDRQPRFKAGAHCTASYCPHIGHCGEVKRMADKFHADEWPTVPEGNGQAGEMAYKLKAIKSFLNVREGLLKEYCRQGGRALAGDWEWKETNSGFRWVRT